MSGNQGETKSGSAAPAVVIPHAPAVVIPQLNQAQSRALARGRTIGHYGHGVQPNPFTLRQRDVYEDERLSDGGGALYTARTQGVLRGIEEVGQHRVAAAPVIRAIGRRNLAHSVGYPFVRGYKDFQDTDEHILGFAGEEKNPISDLTKTFFGAPSKRKGKTRKDPRARGGRRRKRRKGGLNLSGCGEGKVRTRHGCGIRWNANPLSNPLGCCREAGAMPSFWGGRRKKTRKGRRKSRRRKSRRRKSRRRKSRQRGGLITREHTHKKQNTTHHTSTNSLLASFVGGRRKTKKFRKGSKSKTHRGKNFETRKTSKKYNSKRWKRLTGRRTMRAPLFPFV